MSTAEAEAPSASALPAVEMRAITKRFGSVLACDDIDLSIERGRIVGLLGENGAGKTTLMRILLGLITPDSGEIRIHGQPSAVRDPRDAAQVGLAMVHQHFSVIEALTVWENVILGERGRVEPHAAIERVNEVGKQFGIVVNPTARVRDLSAGQRQRAEIIKCLVRSPRVIILDEPTSVLTPSESEELFAVLRRVVASEQRSVVFISHKLDEILMAADEVTVLRGGRVVAQHRSSDTNPRELAREMVGREVSLRGMEAAALGIVDATAPAAPAEAHAASQPGVEAAQVVPMKSEPQTVLSLVDVVARGPDGRRALDGLTLDIHAGEIVGLAGVEGNGQYALQELFSSLLPISSGKVLVRGKPLKAGRPGGMQAAGIGVIPEDRHRNGVVLDLSVAENLILADVNANCERGFLRQGHMMRRAQELIHEYSIATPSPQTPVRSLSGGNQQRVVLARELSRNPAALVAAYPTRGLDVGGMEYVTSCLKRAAESGVGVLLISSDLEEILALAHRIAVIHRGRVIGEMKRDTLDMERLGMMMGGQAA